MTTTHNLPFAVVAFSVYAATYCLCLLVGLWRFRWTPFALFCAARIYLYHTAANINFLLRLPSLPCPTTYAPYLSLPTPTFFSCPFDNLPPYLPLTIHLLTPSALFWSCFQPLLPAFLPCLTFLRHSSPHCAPRYAGWLRRYFITFTFARMLAVDV